MRLIITGVAGFIGMHVAKRLLDRGDEVMGIDNLNDYYDVSLKEARLSCLLHYTAFRFFRIDISDSEAIYNIFQEYKPNKVIHLAAQVGVRYSVKNPLAFINSNLVGFINILEGCRNSLVEHLVYASSSSVYGGNTKLPFSEHDNVDHPVSLYAATKKSNELMAHSYSHLYGLPTTGLRFFTVYGPWGRPDMALFLFTKAILENRSIDVFNHGKMIRDFTYIDDIVEGVVRIFDRPATPQPGFDPANPDPAISFAPYRIFNIGNNRPVQLIEYIEALEDALGQKSIQTLLPIQPGDVLATEADISGLLEWVNFKPGTSVRDGIKKFVEWYRVFYITHDSE
ncbi:MAG: NAD-dependent epimerase [Bacteroidales bacterium]|nr:NAD-dependent epimerase [Bacteroidales bacterium]